MPAIALALGAHERTGVPEAMQLNCLAEPMPTRMAKEGLILRPGLEILETVGSQGVRCIYQRPGLFGGVALVLNGTELYTVTSGGVATLIGAIPGSDVVDISAGLDADLNSVARIATGSALYKVVYDGSTYNVTAEDFPTTGGAGASSVAYHRGDFLAVEAGTDKVYYLLAGQTTWAALSFQSAEYEADPARALRSLGEQAAILGSNTFEVWSKTGAADIAYEPHGGLNQSVGCRSRDTAVTIGETLMFVDDKCQVRQFDGGALKVVSDHGLTEQIRKGSADDLRAWSYELDGHRLYILTLIGEWTAVYDLTTERWTRFSSNGYAFWRAVLGCTLGDTVLAADGLSANIYRLNPEALTDDDGDFTVMFTAFDEVADEGLCVHELRLECQTGVGLNTGQGSSPLVGMKWSDNEGRSWSNLTYKSLGAMGSYVRVVWRRLGIMRKNRLRIYQFTISEPVGRYIYGVLRDGA